MQDESHVSEYGKQARWLHLEVMDRATIEEKQGSSCCKYSSASQEPLHAASAQCGSTSVPAHRSSGCPSQALDLLRNCQEAGTGCHSTCLSWLSVQKYHQQLREKTELLLKMRWSCLDLRSPSLPTRTFSVHDTFRGSNRTSSMARKARSSPIAVFRRLFGTAEEKGLFLTPVQCSIRCN